MAKHGTARDDRRPTVGDLRTVRGKSEVNHAPSRADALDRLIHERLRLGIVSALAVNDSLSFSDLKKLMKTTDGNLSVHARKLEEAEYIACTKSFEGRMPKTEYRLTAAGRRALERYLDHMEALIRATRER
ncbi:MAG TPA: transcriptional regulator [Gemmatimonadaceae bacterium]|nr:transcriptional regulator [Gemmatimonadaceae bacterium]